MSIENYVSQPAKPSIRVRWSVYVLLLIDLAYAYEELRQYLVSPADHHLLPVIGLLTLRIGIAALLIFFGWWVRVHASRNAIALPTRDSRIRTLRLMHRTFVAVVVILAVFTFRFLRPNDTEPSDAIAGAMAIVATASGVSAFIFRKRNMPSADEWLRAGADNSSLVQRWVYANVVSLMLVMSIALFGFSVRVTGASLGVVWPFFVAAIVLLFIWTPSLDDGTSHH